MRAWGFPGSRDFASTEYLFPDIPHVAVNSQCDVVLSFSFSNSNSKPALIKAAATYVS